MQENKLTSEVAKRLIEKMTIESMTIADNISRGNYSSCESVAMNGLISCVDLMQLVSEYMQFSVGETKNEIKDAHKYITELLELSGMYSRTCASAILIARAKMMEEDERQNKRE